MKENKSYASEYADLQRSISAKEHAEAISLLSEFYNKFSDQDLNGELKSMINASIGNIHYVNGHLKKALPVYKELMQETARSSALYTSILERLATILISFNRREEAVSLVVDYLDKDQISWNNTLILLKVLSENNESNQLEKYSTRINWVAQELGLVIPGNNVLENVEYLANENQAANHRYMAFTVTYERLSNEDRTEMLEKYIAGEHVLFYRNLAVKKLNDKNYQAE